MRAWAPIIQYYRSFPSLDNELCRVRAIHLLLINSSLINRRRKGKVPMGWKHHRVMAYCQPRLPLGESHWGHRDLEPWHRNRNSPSGPHFSRVFLHRYFMTWKGLGSERSRTGWLLGLQKAVGTFLSHWIPSEKARYCSNLFQGKYGLPGPRNKDRYSVICSVGLVKEQPAFI